MSGEFKQFFNNRENCPYLRLMEIYLIRAEALIEMGELTDAYGIMELLVGRKGNVAPPNTSAAFLRSYVRALWRLAMPREGRDRKRVVSGMSVSARVNIGVGRRLKQKYNSMNKT